MEVNIYVDEELLEQESNNDIYSLFQKSVYVKTLSQISDKKEEKVDLHLTLNEYQDLQNLKIWEKIDINELQVNKISEYVKKINSLFNFYMISKENLSKSFDKLVGYENFNFDEMMETKNLQEYFFEKVLYYPNRKTISFFPFLNSFLLHKDKYNKTDFYRFLRVFNEYAKRMKWLGEPLMESYLSFEPFQLKEKYSKEDFQWIEEMLFPKELFQIMDEGYDSHQKICEWMNLTEENSLIMKDLLRSHSIVIAGSSLMYLTIRDYPRDEINDIDIWYLDNDKKEQKVKFVKNLQNLFGSSKLKYEFNQGIINIMCEELDIKIQILNTKSNDGNTVIENFDFSCVRAYLNNRLNHFVFTTDFCESMIHKKLYEAYNIHNMVRQFIYFTQRRINKYQKRGFELSSYLQPIMDYYEPTPEVDNYRINEPFKGKLKEKDLSRMLNEYFTLRDMSKYENYGDSNEEERLVYINLKVQPAKEVTLHNNRVFHEYFFIPYVKKKYSSKSTKHIEDKYLFYHIEASSEDEIMQSIAGISPNNIIHKPFLYSKFIFMNYQNGEILPYIKPHEPIQIEEMKEKYNLDSIKFDRFMIYLNHP